MKPSESEGNIDTLQPRSTSLIAKSDETVAERSIQVSSVKMLTVFTPAYNRAGLLENAYRSLIGQTNKHFEWVIVDDGSTDGTQSVCEQWVREEKGFAITYVKTENGGKHRAINKGVRLAKGDLFLILDSDDRLSPDAIDEAIKYERELPRDQRFAGLGFLRGFSESEVNGSTFPGHYLDCKQSERWKHNIFGDKAEVFYTEVLRRYPFPEFDGEKFLTEDAVWYQIAAGGYKIRWINKIIYLGDYLEGGLTATLEKRERASPKGLCFATSVYLHARELSFRRKAGIAHHCVRIVRGSNVPERDIVEALGVNPFDLKLLLFTEKLLVSFRRMRSYFRR
jgi:glycosyltransferase involved in cell wall biosynthesis